MRKFALLSIVIAIAGLAGCSDQPTQPTPTAGIQPMPLNVPLDIQPMLEQYTDAVMEAPAETQESRSIVGGPTNDEYDRYAVTFLWGHLANHPVATPIVTDWSGKLWATLPAGIEVRFPIDFEPGEDSILPAAAVSEVRWVSATGFDVDGIAFQVNIKRANLTNAVPLLVFETTPITLRLPVPKLEHFAAYYPVGNGQGVAVLARRIWPGACPAGALKGRWVRANNTADRGTFDGAWLDRDGNVIGVYAGQFWTNNDGTRELEGWVSGGMTDQVIAEFKGAWWFDDPRLCPVCGDDHGQFRAKLRYLDGTNAHGIVRGEFGDFAHAVDAAVQPMVGVWKIICSNASGQVTTTVSP